MGSVAYNHPIGKDYKWYISGIYCQLGDHISPLLREPGNSIDYFLRVGLAFWEGGHPADPHVGKKPAAESSRNKTRVDRCLDVPLGLLGSMVRKWVNNPNIYIYHIFK